MANREYYTLSDVNPNESNKWKNINYDFVFPSDNNTNNTVSNHNIKENSDAETSKINTKENRNISFHFYGERYMATLYILSQTINFSDKQETKSLKCYIQSFVELLPSDIAGNLMKNFINMTDEVNESIEKNKKLLPANKQGFSISFNNALKDKIGLFDWTFLLNCYLSENLNTPLPDYIPLSERWKSGNISKRDWALAFWFVIHCSAKYASSKNGNNLSSDWIISYKSMMVCLQWILPCPKCRANLPHNLKNLIYN